MPGTGKSGAGRVLSKRLNMRFIDADAECEKEAGLRIAEIFARDGEQAFRALEGEILKRSAAEESCVISCGGGAVLNADAMRLLKASGVTVALFAEPEVICERVKNNAARPLLGIAPDLETIRAIYKKRRPLYEKYADFTVDASDITTEQTAEIIAMLVNKRFESN
jgi:shikimate kinase